MLPNLKTNVMEDSCIYRNARVKLADFD